jgi:hypothetical protein
MSRRFSATADRPRGACTKGTIGGPEPRSPAPVLVAPARGRHSPAPRRLRFAATSSESRRGVCWPAQEGPEPRRTPAPTGRPTGRPICAPYYKATTLTLYWVCVASKVGPVAVASWTWRWFWYWYCEPVPPAPPVSSSEKSTSSISISLLVIGITIALATSCWTRVSLAPHATSSQQLAAIFPGLITPLL